MLTHYVCVCNQLAVTGRPRLRLWSAVNQIVEIILFYKWHGIDPRDATTMTEDRIEWRLSWLAPTVHADHRIRRRRQYRKKKNHEYPRLCPQQNPRDCYAACLLVSVVCDEESWRSVRLTHSAVQRRAGFSAVVTTRRGAAAERRCKHRWLELDWRR